MFDRDTEIVFVHRGTSWYLGHALNQARSASPGSAVVLLGDRSGMPGIAAVPLDGLATDDGRAFAARYVHMSSNSRSFELFCWLRWFFLHEYMRRRRAESVLYLDSDVLLYSPLPALAALYADGSRACGFLVPRQDPDALGWTASGHVSYWTQDALEAFCRFAARNFVERTYRDLYRRKWEWHQRAGVPGGICDMTALYLFWNENRHDVANLAEVRQGGVFDWNRGTALNDTEDEYVLESEKKKVVWEEGRPRLVRSDGTLVRAHALHFQGGGKRDIPSHYTGADFRGRRRRELRVAWSLRAADVVRAARRSLKRRWVRLRGQGRTPAGTGADRLQGGAP